MTCVSAGRKVVELHEVRRGRRSQPVRTFRRLERSNQSSPSTVAETMLAIVGL